MNFLNETTLGYVLELLGIPQTETLAIDIIRSIEENLRIVLENESLKSQAGRLLDRLPESDESIVRNITHIHKL